MAREQGGPDGRSVITLSCDEARKFLLKHESYCSVDLPPYFNFDDLLSGVAQVLDGARLSDFRCKSPREFDRVNYPILHNKDGRYDWRPLELIHPALYISLVKTLTKRCHWELILERFHEFGANSKIKCLSLPVESLTDQKDKAEQISEWWKEVEQRSIELSLDYEFVIQTDIVDCYAAIYTHSIVWSLHSKETAKEKRNDKNLIGNIIDSHIQDMKRGQTNGIPQGSVLMDFIAEMVLGYADTELTKMINCQGIEDYQILRYRDDYRIFVKNPRDGELILKCLTEVMIELGLKLNPSKTNVSNAIIRSSIKNDKLSWTFRREGHKNLQKHLLIIHDHSMDHPNSGSLEVAMLDYRKRLASIGKWDSALPLISIVVDVAYRNPRTYAVSASILSKLLCLLQTDHEKQEVINKINKRFSQIPNTGHMQVWLQRISLSFYPEMAFDEPLCRLVRQDQQVVELWNNDWISSAFLLAEIDPDKVVDRRTVNTIPPVVPANEIELFVSRKTYH